MLGGEVLIAPLSPVPMIAITVAAVLRQCVSAVLVGVEKIVPSVSVKMIALVMDSVLTSFVNAIPVSGGLIAVLHNAPTIARPMDRATMELASVRAATAEMTARY